jgi:hypothetical protein
MPLLKGVSRNEENARGDMGFYIDDREACGLDRMRHARAVRIRFCQVK